MTKVNPYLTFNGNCKEAMTFYQKCLGGELTFQTIGESPLSAKMPQKMKDCILHSTLTKGNLVLMASDMVSAEGLIKGNSVSLSLQCNSEEEIKNVFNKLSANGTIKHHLETTFWGALLGDLTDRYGNNWILNFNKSSLL